MEDKQVFQKKNFYDKNDSGVALLVASLLPTVLLLFVTLVVMMFRGTSEGLSGEIWYLIIAALLSNSALILSVFITNLVGGKSFSSVKVKFNINWKFILLCVGISIICYFGFVNFINVVDAGFSGIGFTSSEIGLPLTNIGWLVLYLVLYAILPAICEELVFRGVIFNGLRKNYSDTFAVVFSGLLFALMHGSIMQFVYPFIMGMIFAIIVLRTGNVLCSIIVHCFNNCLVILFSYFELNFGLSLMLPLTWWGILLSIGIVIVAGIILYLIDKFVFKNKNSESMQIEKEKNGNLGICMIVGLVIISLMFVINLVQPFLK